MTAKTGCHHMPLSTSGNTRSFPGCHAITATKIRSPCTSHHCSCKTGAHKLASMLVHSNPAACHLGIIAGRPVAACMASLHMQWCHVQDFTITDIMQGTKKRYGAHLYLLACLVVLGLRMPICQRSGFQSLPSSSSRWYASADITHFMSFGLPALASLIAAEPLLLEDAMSLDTWRHWHAPAVTIHEPDSSANAARPRG